VYAFGVRALTALVVLFGLAMLGQGPRAAAAFTPVLSLPPNSDADLGGMGSFEPSQDHHLTPLTPDLPKVTQWAFQGPQSSPSSGAGAPSGPSPGSGGPSPLATGLADLPPPALVVRLRVAELLLTSQFDISGVFEPPRIGPRASR
jgi:hypothetical protein